MNEVQQKITAAKRGRQLGLNVAPIRQTLEQLLNEWLADVKDDVKPATYISYEGLVRLHLIPSIGRIAVSKLRPQDVQQFKREKLSSALSARTVQYSLQVLRMALTDACQRDLVPRNVAMLVEYPRVEHEEIRPLTPDEAQRFLQASQGHRLEALFSVALALGLRKGEAIGIQWPSVDLAQGTLRVRQSLQRLKIPGERKGKLVRSEPKRRSLRTVNLPQVCISALRNHLSRQEEERQCGGGAWIETGFVFTSRIGTPLDPRNVNDEFRQVLDKAGLPRIRFHDLRHTAATLLLVQGVHPRVVMDLLGHSQIAITMNTYSHLVPALKREAADQMDAILNPVAQFVAQLP